MVWGSMVHLYSRRQSSEGHGLTSFWLCSVAVPGLHTHPTRCCCDDVGEILHRDAGAGQPALRHRVMGEQVALATHLGTVGIEGVQRAFEDLGEPAGVGLTTGSSSWASRLAKSEMPTTGTRL